MTEPLGGAPSRLRTVIFAGCPISEVYREYVAKIVAHGDGDTCSVILEENGRRMWPVEVRYEHCYAPERSQVGGPETALFNNSILSKSEWCVVRTRGRIDQRSRLIGDVFLYMGKDQPRIDMSKVVSQFITDNGYGHGNS